MEHNNTWCLTEYGHDWSGSIASQLDCQDICLENPLCVGISYSYRAGMMNSCFICKNDVLDQNDYGFAFYRKPGKNNFIGNPPNTHYRCILVMNRRICFSYYFDYRLFKRCRLRWKCRYLCIKLLSLRIKYEMHGKSPNPWKNSHLRRRTV